MTNKERLIYEALLQKPKISLVQLAQKLDYSEVMVELCLKTLKKKGYISENGKINKDVKCVTVIGGSNIDIEGKSCVDILMHDSNPGIIKFSEGGVGRNIVENFARLGGDVRFVTALARDEYGRMIYDHLKELNVDLDDAIVSRDHSTSTYMCVLGEDGEMFVAINDMSIISLISPDLIFSMKDKLNESDFVFFDCNIEDATVKAIYDTVDSSKIIVDAVSKYKVKKIAPFLDKTYCIKLNSAEASELSGIKVENKADVERLGEYFLEKGVKKVYITLGEKGVYFCDARQSIYKKGYKAKVVNATGAGDSFSGAMLYGFAKGYNDEKILNIGMGASLLTIETLETCNKDLSVKKIWERLSHDE